MPVTATRRLSTGLSLFRVRPRRPSSERGSIGFLGPGGEPVGLVQNLGRHRVIAQRYGAPGAAVAEGRHPGGGEIADAPLVGAEVERVVMDEGEHGAIAEESLAAEHAPRDDTAPGLELVAHELDESARPR